MHLRGLNLNLLVAFDALAGAPTLTEAAQRLSLTQSALSGALKQLRQHYNDPLILFSAAGPRLTPLGERLRPIIRNILVIAEDTSKLSSEFDPASSAAIFDLRAADWIELIFLKDVLGDIAAKAPGVSVSVQSTAPRPAKDIFAENADLVLTSEAFLDPDRPSEYLFEDAFACIAWTGNTHVAAGLDAGTFEHLYHVGVVTGAEGVSAVDEMLRRHSVRRNLTVRTSAHAILPQVIIGTDLLAVTSRRFAMQIAPSLPVAVFDLPFAVGPLRIAMQWQAYRESDPAMLWLREQVAARARIMPALPESIGTSVQ
ncbi:LysR family transcriptional regulator [Sphingomonas immobilis]|uniref:LysR family transcriptional regulator n=1 Tax=Sphingomonas immobilis TaxID=3063997 RepID=UPI002729CF05|nr:LysR family transcriptional regulator [Sphingomonas sp. CA1-15]